MNQTIATQRDIQAYGILLLSSLFYAGNVIVARIMADSLPAVALAFVRGVLGIVILLPLGWAAVRETPRPGWRDGLRLALVGFLGITLAYISFLWGIKYTSATNASIIFASNPAITNTLLALFWHTRPRGSQIAGIVLSLLGLLIVFAHGSWHQLVSLSLHVSDLVLLVNVCSIALYNIVGQRIMKKFPPMVTSFYALVFGTLFLLPYGLWQLVSVPWHLDWSGWLAVLYMGCAVTGLAVFFNMMGVNRIGSGAAAIFSNLQPVFSILLAMIMLGEQLALYHWLGFGLVIAGVLMSIW